MALHKLERRYGGKWPVIIKYQNLRSFKEGLILLCQSILKTRRITHLHGSAHFTIPLIVLTVMIAVLIIDAKNKIILDIFIFLIMLTSMCCNFLNKFVLHFKVDTKDHAYLSGN